ncbi:NAD(P)-dependent oxidoreductase [Cupriavidus sp. CuC1]|uniref:NAD(P)-dependent oxidoreductase n=1 Tax=Cupriavidus sp. CuC1 TaxID=3373131 RepID=UPI0037D43D4E
MKEISIIGLGSMGETIARLYLRSGYRVTLWNRTASKAQPLVQEGAVLAPSAAAAARASAIVLMCVYDYKAADEILHAQDVGAALAGRLLIQLTTGSPQDARDSAAWARQQDAAYLDGAIQAAPSQMGQADTPILVSGDNAVFRRAEAALRILGGNIVYLGDKIGSASTMDLATLSYIYGAVLGFMHGARIAESEGIDVAAYGAVVADISPTFGAFLKHEGGVIQSGDFTISESPLRISVEATQRLLQTAREAGINSEFPAYASGLLKRAADAGYGGEELAALIKVLRQ